jgi:hypothetical protein
VQEPQPTRAYAGFSTCFINDSQEDGMRGDRWISAVLIGVVAACAEPTAPLRLDAAAGGVSQSVTGGGQFVHPTFGTVTFAFTAQRLSDGRVVGRFQQHQPAFGFTYQGDVTCFAVDPVNHRAWIGGVLTQSNDPDPVALVGKDAWFRVLDLGEGPDPDRSTFLGFQGSAGIETSEEYCAVRLWAPENARTWPLDHGDIVIH